MHVNAKILWSRIGGVDLTVVRRKIAFLPGDISFAPERVTVIKPEREVSRGRSSCLHGAKG